MDVQIRRANVSDKHVLSNLMQLYLYDFSEIEGGDVDEHGLFDYGYLDRYWTEPGRHAFLVRVEGKIAGFALVNTHSYLESPPDTMVIAEFFILRRYRRKGVGMRASHLVFDLFRGAWEVAQTPANTVAQAFWRNVIAAYTSGHFEEITLHNTRWTGPVQRFRSRRRS